MCFLFLYLYPRPPFHFDGKINLHRHLVFYSCMGLINYDQLVFSFLLTASSFKDIVLILDPVPADVLSLGHQFQSSAGDKVNNFFFLLRTYLYLFIGSICFPHSCPLHNPLRTCIWSLESLADIQTKLAYTFSRLFLQQIISYQVFFLMFQNIDFPFNIISCAGKFFCSLSTFL